MSKERKLLVSIEVTIVWLIIVESMVAVNITDNLPRYIIGATVGTGVAIFFIRNLYDSLDRALDLNEESAKKFYKKKSILRILIVAATIGLALLLSKYISVWAVFIGIMNLKFSVYIQPLTNKYVLTKFFEKGR